MLSCAFLSPYGRCAFKAPVRTIVDACGADSDTIKVNQGQDIRFVVFSFEGPDRKVRGIGSVAKPRLLSKRWLLSDHRTFIPANSNLATARKHRLVVVDTCMFCRLMHVSSGEPVLLMQVRLANSD